MSHYFRSAAKCDVTTAARAPVPLYNEDDDAAAPLEDTTSLSPDSTVSEISRRNESDFQRSRAALDGTIHENIPRDVRRESNILTNLSRREEKDRLRLLQEAKLTNDLMANIRTSSLSTASNEGPLEAGFDDFEVSKPPPPTIPAGTLTPIPVPPPVSGSTPVAAASVPSHNPEEERPVIPIFERIKMEEARCLHRSTLLGPLAAERIDASYGGSIISLYNALTLENVLKSDTQTPPSVLAVKEKHQFILKGGQPQLRNPAAAGVVITSAEERDSGMNQVSEYGAAPYQESQDRTATYRKELAARLTGIHTHEEATRQGSAGTRRLKDSDSAKVLREVIDQDHVRREFMEASRLLKIAQHHELSLVGTFDVERPRVDPLLPALPENVQHALQIAKRPPHPVDTYQQAVRERMGASES